MNLFTARYPYFLWDKIQTCIINITFVSAYMLRKIRNCSCTSDF